jgi:hypothetical protein
MIGILSEPSPQIGGQIGGGLSSDSSTVRLRTLEESFETTAVATVKVASANVRVIKMGFIENSLCRKFRFSNSVPDWTSNGRDPRAVRIPALPESPNEECGAGGKTDRRLILAVLYIDRPAERLSAGVRHGP